MGGDLEIRALKAQTPATTLAHHYSGRTSTSRAGR